jgi:hypothetical protein
MTSLAILSYLSLLYLALVRAAFNPVGPQANSTIGLGTFDDPASLVRPRFRYWLPDASVDPQIVAQDIAAAGSIGAGGVEFLPFFEYGGEEGATPPGSNWSIYNFGTEPFIVLFKAALQAHADKGLKMDFAIGPNQGQGVPAVPGEEGLQWDLVRTFYLGSIFNC